MKPIRVLMVIDYYHPVWGGAQNQLTQLALKLNQKGCQIVIVTRRWKNEYPVRDQVFGFPVFRVGLPGKGGIYSALYVIGLLIFALRNRNRYDIIHTHGAAALGAVGRIMALCARSKNLSKISSSKRIPQIKKMFGGNLILSIFKQSDAFTGLSRQITHQLFNIGIAQQKIKPLHNGVDTQRFKPVSPEMKAQLRTKYNFSDNDIVILFVGRIVKGKGLDLLLRIWPSLTMLYPNLVFVLLGSGKYGSRFFHHDSVELDLKEYVKEHGIHHVVFQGETATTEHFYQLADIFVFPSESEGVSNVLLEAMSSGLGIVASDIEGNKELIDPDVNGLLFLSGNQDDLTKHLRLLIGDLQERLRLGQNARDKVMNFYDFEKIADEYLQTYSHLINKTDN